MFPNHFEHFETWMFWNIFWCWGVFGIINYIFGIGFGFRVFLFLKMGTYFKDIVQHFAKQQIEQIKKTTTRSVNISRTNYVFEIFWGFWVLNGLLTSLNHPPEGYNVAEASLGSIFWRTWTYIYIYIYNYIYIYTKPTFRKQSYHIETLQTIIIYFIMCINCIIHILYFL